MRKELEEARELSARSGARCRQIVADIDRRIRDVNRTALNGPPSTVMPLDEERRSRMARPQAAEER